MSSKRFYVGIDLSVNSTGVCVNDTKSNTHNYFIISGKLSKKQKNSSFDDVCFIEYGKQAPSKEDEFGVREHKKTRNIHEIALRLREIVEGLGASETVCVLEGISYGSSSSSALADLAGLNHTVRYMLTELGAEIRIVAPTQLKKFAVANGAADKALMTAAWLKCQPEMAKLDGTKTDDLADAYFLSECASDFSL